MGNRWATTAGARRCSHDAHLGRNVAAPVEEAAGEPRRLGLQRADTDGALDTECGREEGKQGSYLDTL